MEKVLIVGAIIILALVFAGCRKRIAEQKKPTGTFISEVPHPKWSKTVTFYEVNVSQFPEFLWGLMRMIYPETIDSHLYPESQSIQHIIL